MSIHIINPNLKFGVSCHITDLLNPEYRSYLLKNSHIQALSIYLISENGFSPVKLTKEQITSINEFIAVDCLGIYTCIHSCLRYNLCGASKLTNDPKYKSKKDYVLRGLPEELDYGVVLNSPVIVHLGVCEYKEQGLKLVSHHITTCLEKISPITYLVSQYLSTDELKISQQEVLRRRKLVLENSAGEKNDLGTNIQEIYDIVKNIPEKYHSQLSLCIDTCHTFAAGLSNFEDEDSVIKLFNDLKKIKIPIEVIHLNDSKNPYNCKKDRHEILGKGFIFRSDNGKQALKKLLEIAEKRKISLISETPNSDTDWAYIKSL